MIRTCFTGRSALCACLAVAAGELRDAERCDAERPSRASKRVGGTKVEFLGSIITGIMTLVGVFIGSRLSYGRSIKEKFWGVRREAYGGILSELAEVDRTIKGADVFMATMPAAEYLNSNFF